MRVKILSYRPSPKFIDRLLSPSITNTLLELAIWVRYPGKRCRMVVPAAALEHSVLDLLRADSA